MDIRLLFEVYTEKNFLLFVNFLNDFCALILNFEVPNSKNDDLIERSPLPVDAD